MFKKTQKIAISKNFIISSLLVCLIFLAFGLSMQDSYAADLNETSDETEMELDVEDKLENSQIDEEPLRAISPESNEVLAATHTVNGGTFQNIQNAIDNAAIGDKIVLSGNFKATSSSSEISVYKKLTITSTSSATLDGKGISSIFSIKNRAAGSTISNLKFINGNRLRGGAIYIIADNVVVDNCVFENNHGTKGGGAISSVCNSSFAHNTIVKNCKFNSNSASYAGGAVGLFGINSKIQKCVFTSNRVQNNENKDCFGGAIQIGMDEPDCTGYVTDCTFKNNYAKSTIHTHGGAGCVRYGIVYERCTFINNNADEGGALTFHSSGIIKNCIFINNTANEFGGALSTGFLYDNNMNLNIVGCQFDGNKAPDGGAAQLIGKTIKLDNSIFNNNAASKNGGAVNIKATSVNVNNCNFNSNIANIDGGAVFIQGTDTSVSDSSFTRNKAIPDVNRYDDGLGGAIYVKSNNAKIINNKFYYNTARNGSAVYYDKTGNNLKLTNNTMFQNQAWVYALPIFADDILYGDVAEIKSVIYGGNNIAKYQNLAVSNAIYNGANYLKIQVDNQCPVDGATDTGELYQDSREYTMDILLTVNKDDGTLIYNQTLSSSYLGEVSDELDNLEPGKYYVTAKHFEDTYYKAIENTTSFTVNPKVDTKVRKLSSSDSFDYEDIVVWTLNITNNGPNKATSVVVRDAIPDGLIFIRDDVGGKYDPVTGILEIGDLEVGESIIVNLFTVINRTGEITNEATVESNEYDINVTNNHDNATIDVAPTCDLEVRKLVNDSSPNYGDLITWTIVVRNNGPDMAHDVVVCDMIPESLIWISDDGNHSKESGIWEMGDIEPGQEVRLNIVCRVNSTGIIRNDVNATSDDRDYDLSNNNDSEIIRVSNASDLAIIKSVNASAANFNDLIKWTLVVSNNGPNPATNITVTDILPSQFVYVDSILEKGTYSNGTISMDYLAVGERISLEIICLVKGTGNVTNIANITGNEYDPDLTNNWDEESILIYPAADLEVTKTVNETNPNYGDYVTWTIVVMNNGPDIAHNVTVFDALLDSLVWIDDDSNGQYDSGTGYWACGSLNPGNSIALNIIALVNATGITPNNVSVTSDEFDYNLSNNNASEIIDVEKTADVKITKLVNQTSPHYQDLIRWTLIAENNGPDKATNIYIEDILPEGLILIEANATKGFYDDGAWVLCCLENGERQMLNITCKVNRTGIISNRASISADEADPDFSNNDDTESIEVPKTVDLEVIKEASNHYPLFGEEITWFISVKNNGPDNATDVVVYDLLDDGLNYTGFSSSIGEFINNAWIIGNLEKNQIEYLNITCIIDRLGDISNEAIANSSEYDFNKSNNRDDELVSVIPVADLSVTKIVNASNPNYGDMIKWTIIVSNNGPNNATNIIVCDVMPDGLEMIRASDFMDLDGNWYAGDLNVGEERRLEIVCKVISTGEFTNRVEVFSDEADPDLSNNNDSESIDVPPAADLSITKTASKYHYKVGDVVMYSIKLVNNGPNRAKNIKVSEIPDDSLTLKSVKVTKGYFDESNQTWSIDSLDKGESVELIVKAVAKAAGTVKNKVSVASDTFDYNLKNNNAKTVVKVSKPAKLSKKVVKKHYSAKNTKVNKTDVNMPETHADMPKIRSTGIPFAVLIVSMFLSIVFSGSNIQKKR